MKEVHFDGHYQIKRETDGLCYFLICTSRVGQDSSLKTLSLLLIFVEGRGGCKRKKLNQTIGSVFII